MTPLMLGGVLALEPSLDERWGPVGAWQLPVGAPYALGSGGASPAFQENRGLEHHRGRVTHQGTDLANGQAGDTVRAAASGLVALAHDGDNGNGYGGHIVIAHRLEDGRVAYTVYAHLGRGTLAAGAGDLVCAGDPIARVGQTGRASTPHLHFEVREARDPAERWERARVLEPLPYLLARLAGQRVEAGPDRAYVEWAEYEGLIAGHAEPATPLSRAQWWHMLAGAAADGPSRDCDAPELRDSLIEAGVLPEEDSHAPPDENLGWNEFARDIKRLRAIGVRTPHGPLAPAAHAQECERRFEQSAPSAHSGALRRRSDDPTIGDACVLLADLSGPRAEVELRKAKPASKSAKLKRSKKGKRRPVSARAKKPATAPRVPAKPVRG